ncbi:hypothetical protein ALC53_14263, partial [Atta colombica]
SVTVTRDTLQSQSQLEVGVSLNALASGFSNLSRLRYLSADHHYNLSKTRRAFILPSLNFLLELKAAFYALRCFASNFFNVNILLHIDNITLILINLVLSGILFYLTSPEKYDKEQNIYLFTSYIASIDNVIADSELRVESPKWSLSIQAFDRIQAVHLTFPRFPDPSSWAIDAFNLFWESFYIYVFPLFILFLKILRKTWDDEAIDLGYFLVAISIVVSHVSSLSNLKIVLRSSQSLLSFQASTRPSPEWRSLPLAAGKLSGRH